MTPSKPPAKSSLSARRGLTRPLSPSEENYTPSKTPTKRKETKVSPDKVTKSSGKFKPLAHFALRRGICGNDVEVANSWEGKRGKAAHANRVPLAKVNKSGGNDPFTDPEEASNAPYDGDSESEEVDVPSVKGDRQTAWMNENGVLGTFYKSEQVAKIKLEMANKKREEAGELPWTKGRFVSRNLVLWHRKISVT